RIAEKVEVFPLSVKLWLRVFRPIQTIMNKRSRAMALRMSGGHKNSIQRQWVAVEITVMRINERCIRVGLDFLIQVYQIVTIRNLLLQRYSLCEVHNWCKCAG